MMILDEFLLKKEKKIIIASSLASLDELIKYYALINNASYSNFERKNIFELAKSLFFYLFKDKEYVNYEALDYIFFRFLNDKRNENKDDIYGLIPDVSFNIETAKICLKSINEIRKGERIKDSKNIKIDALINDFEAYLLSNNLFDSVLLIKCIIADFDKLDESIIKKALLLNEDYVFAMLNISYDKLSYLEHLFIDKLMDKLKVKLNIVAPFKEAKDLNIKGYKMYGFYQEVINVINIINKNKLSLVDVEIITSDDKYNNSFKAYLENYHIPYCFSSGVNISSFNQFGLFTSIIDFLKNHYSITALFNIYRNPLIKKEYCDIKYLKKLRADKNQIKVAVSNNSKLDIAKKEFIFDLLKIDEVNQISILFKNIIAFMYKYIDTTKEISLFDKFKEKENIFKLLDGVDTIDKLKVIKDVVSSIKIMVKPIEEAYLTITSLPNVNYFIKKHVFLLGLSSSQMLLKEIESPLLDDNELTSLINSKNYYVNLSSLNNKRLNEKLDYLMKYNDASDIYLSYSEYDSNEFRNLTKSPFYLKFIKEEISPKLNINIDVIDIKDSDSPLILDKSAFNKIKNNNYFSHSSLDKLYRCPLDYIYSEYYLDIKLNEYDNNWLMADESGIFIHSVLENYYLKHPDKRVDEDDFNNIFNQIKDKTILEHPFDNIELINRYLNRNKKILSKYILDASKDSYKVLGCEIKFNEVLIKLNEKDYYFTGIIDRADYFINDANEEVNIRIYDYKTGSKKTLANSGLTQSFIYVYAIKDLIKKRKFKEIDKFAKVNIEFYYVYFKENKRDVFIDEENRLTIIAYNENELKNFDALDNNIASYLKLYHPSLITVNNNTMSKCEYCLYQKYCALKKKVGINKARK